MPYYECYFDLFEFQTYCDNVLLGLSLGVFVTPKSTLPFVLFQFSFFVLRLCCELEVCLFFGLQSNIIILITIFSVLRILNSCCTCNKQQIILITCVIFGG